MIFKQKYSYIDDGGKFYFLAPVIGGATIATDNTCSTYEKLSTFLMTAEEELSSLYQAISLKEILADENALEDINNYRRMLQIVRSELKVDSHGGSLPVSFSSPETSKLVNGINAIIMEPNLNYDVYLKSNKAIFSLPHSRSAAQSQFRCDFGNKLREFMLYSTFPEVSIPKFSKLKCELEKKEFEVESGITNDALEIKILSHFQSTFAELGLKHWDKIEYLIKQRILDMKEWDLFDNSIDISNFFGEIERGWDFIYEDELSRESLFYKYGSDQNIALNKRVDQLSLLTQFFLGITNVYLYEHKSYSRNIGEELNSRISSLGHAFVMEIVNGARSKGNIENIIFNFLEKNLATGPLNKSEKDFIIADFKTKWDIIKDSDHMDEFFLLPTSTSSPFFIYANSMSCDFSHFALKCLETKKPCYDEVHDLKAFFKQKRAEFQGIARNQDNSVSYLPIKPIMYLVGDEHQLKADIDTYISTRELPYYIPLTRARAIPKLMQDSGLDSDKQWVKSINILNSSTDELRLSKVKSYSEFKSYIDERYEIKFVDKSSIDVTKLADYPESIQRYYLKNDKRMLDRLTHIRVDLKSLGYDLSYLIGCGYTPRDLLYAGYTIVDFREAGVSFFDIYDAGFTNISDYKNVRVAEGFEFSNNARNVITGFAIYGAENMMLEPVMQRHLNFNAFKELNLTATNLRGLGYSLYDLWKNGYSKESILVAGYNREMVEKIFTLSSDCSKEIVFAAFSKMDISLIDLKGCMFKARELKKYLGVDNFRGLLAAGYSKRELEEAQIKETFFGVLKRILGVDKSAVRVTGGSLPVAPRRGLDAVKFGGVSSDTGPNLQPENKL